MTAYALGAAGALLAVGYAFGRVASKARLGRPPARPAAWRSAPRSP